MDGLGHTPPSHPTYAQLLGVCHRTSHMVIASAMLGFLVCNKLGVGPESFLNETSSNMVNQISKTNSTPLGHPIIRLLTVDFGSPDETRRRRVKRQVASTCICTWIFLAVASLEMISFKTLMVVIESDLRHQLCAGFSRSDFADIAWKRNVISCKTCVTQTPPWALTPRGRTRILWRGVGAQIPGY